MNIGDQYPLAQLAKALAANDHTRADRWRAVLRGMASGTIKVGSRTPVKGLPAWVTPEVVRGGFATGRAAAAPGDVDLFVRALAGGLGGRLESGDYAVVLPEHAALLTIEWLRVAGHEDAAEALVRELAPFAGKLRFAPVAAQRDPTPREIVWRQTAADSQAQLNAKRPQPRVATMNATLTVWHPYADALLDHWLETVVDGVVAARFPDGWHERGRALLARYDELVREHVPPSKHHNPKANAAILRHALADATAYAPKQRRWPVTVVPAPSPGLLRHAVDSMLAKRGAPGSERHAAVRAEQAAVAARPMHHQLARVVAGRLGDADPERAIDSADAFLAPIDGTPVPPSLARVVERALAGTPEELIGRGVIPSAEVLAELVPRLAAATVAGAYEDERLAALMAANYEAFRRRRTLLLTNLEHQVRVEELPWVRAVAPYRRAGAVDEAQAAFVRLGELTLDAFPATLIPNAMLSELGALAREAGLDLPLVEELAADIFEGRFSSKFARAAALADRVLRGSLYQRYYRIDPATLDGDFGALCAGARRHAPTARTSRPTGA